MLATLSPIINDSPARPILAADDSPMILSVAVTDWLQLNKDLSAASTPYAMS